MMDEAGSARMPTLKISHDMQCHGNIRYGTLRYSSLLNMINARSLKFENHFTDYSNSVVCCIVT
jgi:hypothetical protein